MSMPRRLADVAPELERVLLRGTAVSPPLTIEDIRRETVRVAMRDGVRLATDVYLPPAESAPVLAVRTPYGRDQSKLTAILTMLARHGYAIVAQDCRGTGDSEPQRWDYYVYEREDSFDCVEWIVQQTWCNGFLAGLGGSYLAQTQWCMALHPRMSAIAPEVGGLGIAFNTARLYMFLNAYARSIGKGADKVSMPLEALERHMLPETLAGGYFNEPLHRPFTEALLRTYPNLCSLAPAEGQRWLWRQYCSLPAAQRAGLIKQALGVDAITITAIEELPAIFGQHIAHDAHMFAYAEPSELCRALHAPALMITGWYDWALNDALATWRLIARDASDDVRANSRLIITPSAHNAPGYHEDEHRHPELARSARTENILALIVHGYAAMRENTLESWPTVMYYLMGANEWHAASAWPPPQAEVTALHLNSKGALSWTPAAPSPPDTYVYDPVNPPPTLGGSIVSHVYPPGSVDVSAIQEREDVLTYTTAPLERDLDVVGPLKLVLHASSSAADTDFCARLSDVFPDGRAIQLQSGLLRARYRGGEPRLLRPNRIYRLEIDLWATANRFKAGHRLRVDISSADFPRFDRNANRGGRRDDNVEPTLPARQTVHHDPEHPSHLVLYVLGY